MLRHLSVKNFALIEDLSLDFAGGLNVLTGETGAGKTIVLEALGLALGDKSSAHQIRQGAARLSVAAVFESPSKALKKILVELQLDGDGNEVLFRRELDASGRSRAFVNDQPVSATTLARLGVLLMERHGQHEHQLLTRPAEQRDLLDAFGGLGNQRAAVEEAYTRWRDVVAEGEALQLSEQERTQRLDLYTFQRNELAQAAVKPDEEEVLERLLPQLKNAEKLQTLAAEAHGLLYAEEGATVDTLRRVKKNLESLVELGADLGETLDMVNEAVVRLDEAAARLDAFKDGVDLDPERVDEVMTRMDLLSKLKKKYGPTLADVLAHQAKVEEELRLLERAEERGKDLAERLASAEKVLKDAAAKLTRGREASAKKLAEAVQKELKDVGLARADFKVSVAPLQTAPAPGAARPAPAFSAAGADAVSFRFLPNPGEGWQELAAVASGGELSRVMLALKSVMAKAEAAPTLIFDEIDAGVGGEMGPVLGRKLARLGKTHQVICITHLASIAAAAGVHFAVEKEVKRDRTRSTVRRLSEEERVPEIARMLGGAAARSDKKSVSVEHARVLLTEAKR